MAGPGDDLHIAGLALARDRARRLGGIGQRRQGEIVGVGETCLLAADRAHTSTVMNAVDALLDDAVLQIPGFPVCYFEVQIGEIDGVGAQPRQ